MLAALVDALWFLLVVMVAAVETVAPGSIAMSSAQVRRGAGGATKGYVKPVVGE